MREILASDAATCDRAAKTPYTEVALLKDSGLVTLLGPTAEGGGGQEWPLAYRVIREVSAGDGSIGQLLGHHYLWLRGARLVGTPEQIAAVEADATRNQWFFGGAVKPRDSDLQIRDEGDHIAYSGRKTFSTGSKVPGVAVLEGVLEGADTRLSAIVPSDQPGVTFHDDLDNIGPRLTESGGVTVSEVPPGRASDRCRPRSAGAGVEDEVFGAVDVMRLGGASAELLVLVFWAPRPAVRGWPGPVARRRACRVRGRCGRCRPRGRATGDRSRPTGRRARRAAAAPRRSIVWSPSSGACQGHELGLVAQLGDGDHRRASYSPSRV